MSVYDDWKTTDVDGEMRAKIQDIRDEKHADWVKANKSAVKKLIEQIEQLNDEYKSDTVIDDDGGEDNEDLLSAIAMLESIIE